MTDKTRFLFVLGAHRSGTSLTAGACDALGANLGRDFIAASDENPKGFFEDQAVVNLNDRLLRSASLSWDCVGYLWQEDFLGEHYRPYHRAAVDLVRERFAGVAIAALKDPRLCILLPFWRSVVSEALDADIYYLLTVRDPAHCAGSQRARHIADGDFHLLGQRREHAVMLWATYLHHSLQDIDPTRSLVVSYDALVAQPRRELSRLGQFLGVAVTPAMADAYSEQFVDAQLNRSAAKSAPGRQRLPQVWLWADSVYSHLLSLSSKDSLPVAELDALRAALAIDAQTQTYLRETQRMYGYAYKKVLSLRHRLIRVIREIGEGHVREDELQFQQKLLREQLEDTERRLQEILDSKAWRMIVRFRNIKAALGLGPRPGKDG